MKMNRFIFVVLMLIMVGALLSIPAFAQIEQEQNPLFAIVAPADVMFTDVQIEGTINLMQNQALHLSVPIMETVSPTYRVGANLSRSLSVASMFPSFQIGKMVSVANCKEIEERE